MQVMFWGVRGTFPAPGDAFVRYGGETMCIEVRCGEDRIILDAGTGLRLLGQHLAKAPRAMDAHLLLSHAHIDHLLGLLQFAPLWRPGAQLNVWTVDGTEDDPAAAARALLAPPYMPVGAAAFPASVAWRSVGRNERFHPCGAAIVTPIEVNHPGGAIGFRIDCNGKSLAYVTDHEHGDPEVDARLARWAAGVDLLVYDATFTEAELHDRKGWGHSTWQAGVRLRDAARAGLVTFVHHEPGRTDAQLDIVAAQAARAARNAAFARQGMSIVL